MAIVNRYRYRGAIELLEQAHRLFVIYLDLISTRLQLTPRQSTHTHAISQYTAQLKGHK